MSSKTTAQSQMALLLPPDSDRVIASVRLEATAQRAWYELSLKAVAVGFLIEKESGGDRGKGRQRETWYRPDLAEALKKYRSILASKINPARRSPRKYAIVRQTLRFAA